MKQARVLAFFILLVSFRSLFAAEAININTFGSSGGFFSGPDRTDTAIRGYDTVAYFTVGKPVRGNDQFVTEYKGAKWKFSNQENLEKFKADPAKYAPQYGGYCAYGIANDSLVKIEPDQWTIVDGKLYLNYDDDINKKWKKDQQNYIKKADEKFGKLIQK